MALQHPAIVREHALLVRDGRVVRGGGAAPEGDWVYAWTRPSDGGRVLYVGATALALAERTKLHLESAIPTIGRVRAEHPEALQGDIVVRGFLLAPGSDRQAVKRALTALLLGGGFEADPTGRPIAEAVAARIER